MLKNLIRLNVGVYLCCLAAFYVFSSIGEPLPVSWGEKFWLASTGNLDLLLDRPWTIFSYMFTHDSLWHLLVNMAILWWMGNIYLAEVGPRRLLSTYLLGGVAGWLLFVIGVNTFPRLEIFTDNWVVGASASVMAIFVAVATLLPERRLNLVLFGSVQLQHIAIAYIALDYFSNGDPASFVGHAGGALFGFFLIQQKRKGRDLARWFEVTIDAVVNILPDNSSGPMKVKYSSKSTSSTHSRPKSDDQFNSERKATNDRVDAILDKISRHGYDHLSKADKEFLFKHSKK